MRDQTEPGQHVRILLVEDDDVDVEVVKRGFRKQRIANPVVVASDGVEALEILRGTDGRAPLPRPYIILLDLNMPRMSGIEFLQAVRGDPDLQDSVVFVLTTSQNETDRIRAYKQHVAGYMVKSQAGSSFKQAIEMLSQYWTVVILPE